MNRYRNTTVRLEERRGLGTIPLSEFVDGVPIVALRFRGAKAANDSRFGLIEIWKIQPGLRFSTFRFFDVLLMCSRLQTAEHDLVIWPGTGKRLYPHQIRRAKLCVLLLNPGE